jgi:hypothetical protein
MTYNDYPLPESLLVTMELTNNVVQTVQNKVLVTPNLSACLSHLAQGLGESESRTVYDLPFNRSSSDPGRAMTDGAGIISDGIYRRRDTDVDNISPLASGLILQKNTQPDGFNPDVDIPKDLTAGAMAGLSPDDLIPYLRVEVGESGDITATVGALDFLNGKHYSVPLPILVH